MCLRAGVVGIDDAEMQPDFDHHPAKCDDASPPGTRYEIALVLSETTRDRQSLKSFFAPSDGSAKEKDSPCGSHARMLE